jgi:hypothetical protein
LWKGSSLGGKIEDSFEEFGRSKHFEGFIENKISQSEEKPKLTQNEGSFF